MTSTTNPKNTVIVTGTNIGLGLETASQLLSSSYSDGYHFIFTVRDPDGKSSANLRKLLLSHPSKNAEAAALSLSTLAGVRAFAVSINQRVQSGQLGPIRALITNAAIQDLTGVNFTEDGFEKQFGINYLANFLLVLLLLKSIDREHGRVVLLSSWMHNPAHKRNAAKLPKYLYQSPELMARPPPDKKGKESEEGMRRYGVSKALILMFMYELQRRLNSSSVTHNISILSLDPQGMLNTGLFRDNTIAKTLKPLAGPITSALECWAPGMQVVKAETSAKNLLYAAFDTATLGEHPKTVNIGFQAKIEETSEETRDETKQKELWAESIKMAQVQEGDTIVEL